MPDETDACRRDVDRLRKRIGAVKAEIELTTDSSERYRQTERLRILKSMYKDACENLERLRPAGEKRSRGRKKAFSADSFSWDFFERTNVCFSDVEGTGWSALETGELTANQSAALQKVLHRAMEALTPRQREFLSLRMEGRSVTEIAKDMGVMCSTASRTLKRAVKTLEHLVCAHAFVGECFSGGRFDLYRFAARADLLTPRQREILYFLLSDASMAEISRYIGRACSTVHRANERVVGRLAAVCIDAGAAPPPIKTDRQSWAGKSEREAAELLGIPKAVYYRVICARERVGPYSRWEYELIAGMGQSVSDAARELGCSPECVRRNRARLAGADITALPAPIPYAPSASAVGAGAASLRGAISTLASGGGTIGDAVSAEIYRKMLAVSGG